MKALWKGYAQRFDALALRERALVFLCAVAVVIYVGAVLLVEPEWTRKARLEKQRAQQQSELAQLQGQLALLQQRLADPDAPARRQLHDLRQQIGRAEGQVREMEASLVPPQQVPVLLQELLGRRPGLKLVALRTLPVRPLLEQAAGGKAQAAAPAANPVAPAAQDSGIYRHGVEITVQGGYHDLVAYLAGLEALPQRLYWHRARLQVAEHPLGVLTVTVYTLSLERAWLTV